jgi:hypothetical protein
MKFPLSNLVYAIILSLAIISCKDDEEIVDPIPTPNPPTSDVISNILPQTGAANQSVFVNPLIIFKYKIGQTVQLSNNPSNYKLVLDDAKLLMPAESEATLSWTTNKDSLVIIPKTVLSPQTNYTIYVKTHWEEEKTTGSWEPVTLDNVPQVQISEKTFTTENIDISRILLTQIKFNYPIANQFNFLKSEYPQGYVTLKNSLQNYLFEASSGAIQYQFKARFTSPGKSNIEVPLTFDQTTTTLAHDIPSGLVNETIYKLQYLKIPDNGGAEQELYAIYFRTSKHNSFIEKMDSYSLSNTFSWETNTGASELSIKLLNQTEYFDYMEANVDSVNLSGKGIYFSVGLIQFEALAGNTWYDEKVHPLLYKDLSTSGLTWQRSNVNLKTPPVNGIYIRRAASYASKFTSFRKLTQEEIENNQSASITDQGTLVYNIGPATAFDYLYLRALAANSNSTSTYVQTLKSTNSYPNLTFGTYQVKMKYVLPGKTSANSEKTISFTYN